MVLGTDDPLAQGIPMRVNTWASVESDLDGALIRLSELVSEKMEKMVM